MRYTAVRGRYGETRPLHVCNASRTLRAAGNVVTIRHAEISEFWSAADLHCKVFHEDPSRGYVSPVLFQSLMPPTLTTLGSFLDRVDRVACLMSLHRHAEGGAGRCALILAFQQQSDAQEDTCTARHAHDPGPEDEHRIRDTFYKTIFKKASSSLFTKRIMEMMLSGHPGQGLGVGAQEVHLVGSCFVDSFGDLIPARSMDANRDGAVGWYKREGVAYVSNIAVLPEARGQGVARQLMDEAHLLAQKWECRSVGLHCNKKNTPAVTLYERMGYRKTVLEPAIMPYLNGRAPDRCHFYMKSVVKKGSSLVDHTVGFEDS
ncbi:hypothetical protein CEUSTIGMA_g3937.t1 [Chlamydomonas eustigma]|uniref:N-acetyltransferase domain-containing protein n=1 Tax=Chlamydomonas eustigma TaxID=1157962 RepID=A0A250X0S0_9CHLO|nr:hypothetical protein CEUSTIGMA_g3937.t1 [Chlamydomonas eustigma]|eukprot:GAX76492.1 hypothetical protein CEUSTIGMA_g3937.t1 [Chlamydomonas eustigma]